MEPSLKDLHIYGLRSNMIVKEKRYSIDEVYEAVKDHLFDSLIETKSGKKDHKYLIKSRRRVELDGEMVKANSQRLQLFYTKGFKCVVCGTEGKFFIMCKAPGEKHYHLELIGQTTEGEYVMMTKDHILPKSKGGKDELENYQTMCCRCNVKKGNSPDEYIKGNIEDLKASNIALYNENKELKAEIIRLKEIIKNSQIIDENRK